MGSFDNNEVIKPNVEDTSVMQEENHHQEQQRSSSSQQQQQTSEEIAANNMMAIEAVEPSGGDNTGNHSNSNGSNIIDHHQKANNNTSNGGQNDSKKSMQPAQLVPSSSSLSSPAKTAAAIAAARRKKKKKKSQLLLSQKRKIIQKGFFMLRCNDGGEKPMLRHILSYLGSDYMSFMNVITVCKEWKDIIYHTPRLTPIIIHLIKHNDVNTDVLNQDIAITSCQMLSKIFYSLQYRTCPLYNHNTPKTANPDDDYNWPELDDNIHAILCALVHKICAPDSTLRYEINTVYNTACDFISEFTSSVIINDVWEAILLPSPPPLVQDNDKDDAKMKTTGCSCGNKSTNGDTDDVWSNYIIPLLDKILCKWSQWKGVIKSVRKITSCIDRTSNRFYTRYDDEYLRQAQRIAAAANNNNNNNSNNDNDNNANGTGNDNNSNAANAGVAPALNAVLAVPELNQWRIAHGLHENPLQQHFEDNRQQQQQQHNSSSRNNNNESSNDTNSDDVENVEPLLLLSKHTYFNIPSAPYKRFTLQENADYLILLHLILGLHPTMVTTTRKRTPPITTEVEVSGSTAAATAEAAAITEEESKDDDMVISSTITNKDADAGTKTVNGNSSNGQNNNGDDISNITVADRILSILYYISSRLRCTDDGRTTLLYKEKELLLRFVEIYEYLSQLRLDYLKIPLTMEETKRELEEQYQQRLQQQQQQQRLQQQQQQQQQPLQHLTEQQQEAVQRLIMRFEPYERQRLLDGQPLNPNDNNNNNSGNGNNSIITRLNRNSEALENLRKTLQVMKGIVDDEIISCLRRGGENDIVIDGNDDRKVSASMRATA